MLAMLGGGALAGVVPSVAGAADLAMGPTNLSNSGEVGINPLLAMLPGVGAGVGIAASGLNKDVRDLARSFQLERKPASQATPEDVEFGLRMREQMQQDAEKVTEKIRKLAAERAAKGQPPLTEDEARVMMLRGTFAGRGLRNLGASALIGSVAGAVPAVMLMRDSQPAQQPVVAQ